MTFICVYRVAKLGRDSRFFAAKEVYRSRVTARSRLRSAEAVLLPDVLQLMRQNSGCDIAL